PHPEALPISRSCDGRWPLGTHSLLAVPQLRLYSSQAPGRYEEICKGVSLIGRARVHACRIVASHVCLRSLDCKAIKGVQEKWSAKLVLYPRQSACCRPCTIRVIADKRIKRGRDMPGSIDFPQGRLEPREPRGPRLRRRLIVFLIVVAAIFFGAKTALSYWVDLLWFRSLGYADVFWTTWRIEWGVFALFAVATFVLLYGAFLALKRASQASLPSDRQILLGGQPVNLSVEPVLRIVGIVGSLAAAALTGTAMMQEWPTLALFWYAPHASGSISDPIFGRPLNFFLFTLPAWQLILGWLLTLA